MTAPIDKSIKYFDTMNKTTKRYLSFIGRGNLIKGKIKADTRYEELANEINDIVYEFKTFHSFCTWVCGLGLYSSPHSANNSLKSILYSSDSGFKIKSFKVMRKIRREYGLRTN